MGWGMRGAAAVLVLVWTAALAAARAPDDVPPATVAAVEALERAVTEYLAARRLCRAREVEQAIRAYRAVAEALLPLTAVEATGPIARGGTQRIDRVAQWFLHKAHRDIAALFLRFSLAHLEECARLEAAVVHARLALAAAAACALSRTPTTRLLRRVTARLQAADCPLPPSDATPPSPDPDVPDAGDAARPRDDPPAPAPPAAAEDLLEGFGSATRGGDGGREIVIAEATEAAVRDAFEEANRGGPAILRFEVAQPIVIGRSQPPLPADFLTLDGAGATLIAAPDTAPTLVDIRGHDVVVRNLRLRNGYDNLRIQGDGAHDIVVSHVSSTGARDDGISIGYGARNVTVQWSLVAGNTRSVFIKYGGTTDVSIHHTWILKQWARGPLVSSGALVDIRNVIVEDWTLWGMRFEENARGNVVDSLFVLGPHALTLGAKATAALRLRQTGPVFTSGNVFAGHARAAEESPERSPASTPPVTTDTVEIMAPRVRARAGCLPRDPIDRAYVELETGWTVEESVPLRLSGAS